MKGQAGKWHKEFSRKGGLSRAKKLTKKERQRIAKLGADAAEEKRKQLTMEGASK
jgi:hypothetical protein